MKGLTSSHLIILKVEHSSGPGHFSRFFIQSVTGDEEPKSVGGDSWRVYIRDGPASLSPIVLDHNNGEYEVLFLVLEPGLYSAQVYLDYTLCDGFRDPPRNWFQIGNNNVCRTGPGSSKPD